MAFNDKHTRMYMRQAQAMASPEHNSCLSRAIGVVIVKNDVPGGRIVATGFNGPAAHLPKPDSQEHLEQVVIPQLNDEEYARLYSRACQQAVAKGDIRKVLPDPAEGCREAAGFVAYHNSGCGKCPRQLVGAKSGERLELCNCAHAEENAIVRATENLGEADCTMFCWCGVPCAECCRKIINAGIKHLVVIDWGFTYSRHSLWMLRKANVSLEVRNPETLEVVDAVQ